MSAEFFLKALKDNSDHIVNASLGALSQKNYDNGARIATNSSSISSLTTTELPTWSVEGLLP